MPAWACLVMTNAQTPRPGLRPTEKGGLWTRTDRRAYSARVGTNSSRKSVSRVPSRKDRHLHRRSIKSSYERRRERS